MEVVGRLGDFDVAGILQLLGLRGATGRLEVAADGDRLTLFLERGRLAGAASERLPLRLGWVLVQRRLLDPGELREVLRQQAAEGRARPLGAIVVERGWATPAQVARCVEEQCVAALARALAAERGAFGYAPGGAGTAGIAATPLAPERALLEASRRSDELVRLRALLPDPRAALVPAPGAGAAPNGPAERAVLAALRAGAGCLADLGEGLPLDEAALLRAVIGLRERGLVAAEGEPDGPGGGLGRGDAGLPEVLEALFPGLVRS
jgi:hypothetical protein